MDTLHRLLPEKAHASYAAYLSETGSSAVDIARRRAPEDLVAVIKASGLKGRGGAGFPTGVKWETFATHPCRTRYVVCNAAEGEPGTFKDRWLIRKNPYAVVEGLLIAARAIGAREAYLALKGSFLPETEALQRALAEMRAVIDLPVRLVHGPDEYLFGEEKALLNVIEGEGPFPRPLEQPPYEWGLFASPTCANPALVNNAQTLAHVSTILRHGPASFRETGTEDTPGTLIVTLSGTLSRPGIYEVPAGLPLDRLLGECGGGPLTGRRFKAVLPGVSSSAIPSEIFSALCDFGSLKALGSGLGSAGFIVVDDSVSIPRVAQAAARFLYVESCVQCFACKTGLRAASEAIDELFSDRATPDDPEKAVLGARSAPQGNRCTLPEQGSHLISSLVSLFSEEFEALVRRSAPPGPEWTLPKMVDFLEEERRFVFDTRQALKRPDWSFPDQS